MCDGFSLWWTNILFYKRPWNGEVWDFWCIFRTFFIRGRIWIWIFFFKNCTEHEIVVKILWLNFLRFGLKIFLLLKFFFRLFLFFFGIIIAFPRWRSLLLNVLTEILDLESSILSLIYITNYFWDLFNLRWDIFKFRRWFWRNRLRFFDFHQRMSLLLDLDFVLAEHPDRVWICTRVV